MLRLNFHPGQISSTVTSLLSPRTASSASTNGESLHSCLINEEMVKPEGALPGTASPSLCLLAALLCDPEQAPIDCPSTVHFSQQPNRLLTVVLGWLGYSCLWQHWKPRGEILLCWCPRHVSLHLLAPSVVCGKRWLSSHGTKWFLQPPFVPNSMFFAAPFNWWYVLIAHLSLPLAPGTRPRSEVLLPNCGSALRSSPVTSLIARHQSRSWASSLCVLSDN